MTYRLLYLNIRARGEPIRWLLRALEVEFEEERIDMFTEWGAKKEELKWGQTPVLEVDGEHLGQTTVICRYLGEKHDLAVEDSWTATRQQEAVEYLHDVSSLAAFAFYFRMKGDEEQKEFFMGRVRERLPMVVKNLEDLVTDEAGWLLSPKMTWVDVFVAAYLDQYVDMIDGLLEEAPKLQELLARVRSLPSIQEWLEARPALHEFESNEGL
ncbi:hypothetical protein O3P69_001317 [Scylla paramamosain]|uniref:glutathione transferase n=1 Tax=Scylla paramamosain TaxID=85552 RepID=A0AAW0URR1_SCYPA